MNGARCGELTVGPHAVFTHQSNALCLEEKLASRVVAQLEHPRVVIGALEKRGDASACVFVCALSIRQKTGEWMDTHSKQLCCIDKSGTATKGVSASVNTCGFTPAHGGAYR